MKGESLEVRFWSKVKKMSGCWLWTGGKLSNGYGVIWRDGRHRYAHRIAFELQHGSIPAGKHVLHRCNTPLCQRGTHIYAGTDTENQRDRISAGTSNRGERNGQAKLTSEEVVVIRALRGHLTQKRIAAMFSIDQSTVCDVQRGKHWKYVPTPAFRG